MILDSLVPKTFAALLSVIPFLPSGAEPAAGGVPVPAGVQFKGTVQEAQGVFSASGNAILLWESARSGDERLQVGIRLSSTSRTVGVRLSPDAAEPVASAAPVCVILSGDPAGCSATVLAYNNYNPQGQNTYRPFNLYYSPFHPDAAEREKLARAFIERKIPIGLWTDRWIPLSVEWRGDTATVWVEGLAAAHRRIDPARKRTVTIELPAGSQWRAPTAGPLERHSLLLPLDLTDVANATAKPRLPAARAIESEGVPFIMAAGGGADLLSLRRAEWITWREDPPFFDEPYDFGPPVLRDPRMPFLRVPKADYVAAHLLARAADAPDTGNRITLRAGAFGAPHGQARTWDFTGRVPRITEKGVAVRQDERSGPGGRWFHVRLPMPESFAQDVVGDLLEIELTKEVRLARRSPDPCRFRERPLGLPSGVEIAAITLEKSPLQMVVASRKPGHVFVAPETPAFSVNLTNISEKRLPFTVRATALHRDGRTHQMLQRGHVEAGETRAVALPLAVPLYGYHDLEVSLSAAGRSPLLRRRTSFAWLPPDTRRHRDRSPFGTWDFGAAHFGNPDSESSAALHVAMGLKWTFLGPKELRKRFGLARGIEPCIHGSPEHFGKTLEENPDQSPVGLIFHENSISYDHIVRVPDLFTDWPPYLFNESEQKQFDGLWQSALAGAQAFRKAFPQCKISFGNGVVSTREAFYRRGLPPESFDYAGNETGSYGRPPEAQPPDYIANNASLWMDRMLLDHYGYKDKPIQQCYEACYVNTNPGNVSLSDQADYYPRHALHALAWNIPTIRYGMMNDVSNSYYYSNWGASGFLHRYPELNPKPSFVTMATLTRVLDGVAFVRAVDVGSPSTYLFEFQRPDGEGPLWAAWTLRGTRPLRLSFAGMTDVKLTDGQGQERPLKGRRGFFELELTPSPLYVSAHAPLAETQMGEPEYTGRPLGKVTRLARLDDLGVWEIERERDPVLEFYGMTTPRRLGRFRFDVARSYRGRNRVLRVCPESIEHGKPTMPMYMAVRHKTGIPVPGQPTEIGLWIHGNSGWGRVLFELEDASGQRWSSIGAPSTDPLPHWFEEVMPADLKTRYQPVARSDWNTEDVFGISRINFDGWRYVGFPMPGHYPGEGYPWPGNSQWRHDKDGRVRYPLRLTRLIVELPEKVLHATRFDPPPVSEIALSDLVVGEDETPKVR